MPSEQGHRRHDDAAPILLGGQRLHRQTGQGGGTTRHLDLVQPQDDVVRRARDTVRDAGLRRAPCPGQDAEQSGLARCGVRRRFLERERTSPLEWLVELVRMSRERPLPPADDALVDLEPPADLPRASFVG